jgi:hypothetical protein
VINGEIRLAHVYFSQEQFALGCVTLLDREPRALQLHESTFLEDASQARRFHQLIALNWHEPAERLLTSSLAHEMLSHTLLSQVGARDGLRLKAGWRRTSGGCWWSTSTSTWKSRSASGNWPGCARCPNTILRGCSARASACRPINTCWRDA